MLFKVRKGHCAFCVWQLINGHSIGHIRECSETDFRHIFHNNASLLWRGHCKHRRENFKDLEESAILLDKWRLEHATHAQHAPKIASKCVDGLFKSLLKFTCFAEYIFWSLEWSDYFADFLGQPTKCHFKRRFFRSKLHIWDLNSSSYVFLSVLHQLAIN